MLTTIDTDNTQFSKFTTLADRSLSLSLSLRFPILRSPQHKVLVQIKCNADCNQHPRRPATASPANTDLTNSTHSPQYTSLEHPRLMLQHPLCKPKDTCPTQPKATTPTHMNQRLLQPTGSHYPLPIYSRTNHRPDPQPASREGGTRAAEEGKLCFHPYQVASCQSDRSKQNQVATTVGVGWGCWLLEASPRLRTQNVDDDVVETSTTWTQTAAVQCCVASSAAPLAL